MVLWVVQVVDGLGQPRVVSFPSEFPRCGSILQGEAPQRTAVSLGMSCPILCRLISCTDICPVRFQFYPLSVRHELLLRLSAQVPLLGAVTSTSVLDFETELG